MKIYFYLVFIVMIGSALSADAQSFYKYKRSYEKIHQQHGQLSFYGGIGNSSYMGDLKTNRVSLDGRHNLTFGGQYKYNTYVSFRGELTWYRIAGSDANQPVETGLPSRNLSFRADNIEIHAAGVINAFPRYKTRNAQPVKVNPYLFLGIGATTNNPTAEYGGNRYNLRRLETQGYRYSGFALVIPFGLGVNYRVNNSFDVGFEAGYRYAFTDQLDDSSKPDFVNLDLFENPIARALSDRRNEVGIIPGAPEGSGSVRGNPKANDGYLLLSLRGHYYIPTMRPKSIRYRKPKSQR